MKTSTISVALCFAGLGLAARSHQAVGKVEPGSPAPLFTVASAEGKTVSLADYKGKYVVLEWTNKDCPFVKKHYGSGNMQSVQEKATKLDVVWLTICSSAPGKQGYMTQEDAKQRLKDANMHGTALLLDSDSKVARTYGARTTPHMFVIDPKGIVIYNGAIDDKPTPDPADIKGAKNYVMAALEESMAGKAVSVPKSVPYGCSVKY